MGSPRVNNLNDAYDIFDPRPLQFAGGGSGPTDERFYTELPQPDGSALSALEPMMHLRRRLLSGSGLTKVFLSGHVGSGKSTQINKLAVDERITRAFEVVLMRLESEEWDTIDAAQVQFRIAMALYEWANKKGLLDKQVTSGDKKPRWRTVFEQLESAIYGPTGIQAKDGKIGVEFDLVLFKLKEELTLSEGRRKQLREIGETQQSLLRDLIGALVNDIENKLSQQGQGRSLLLLVDDLDKVARADNQKDIFERNLPGLLTMPLRVLFTVPSGVYFGSTQSNLRQQLEYLYPIRTLNKAPHTFDPEEAYFPDHFPFFQTLVHSRVTPSLVEDDAIRLASIYSGGVLREFFHLLREAILIADFHKVGVVDKRTMMAAITDARRREAPGLYSPDFAALSHVHRTNDLSRGEDRRYLDEGRVIECNNGRVWFEVNPLLWSMLEGRA
ncbi:MAG: hypothetical protein IPM54_00855 [Polyangiaceae bacterium]|nr:hypothetical protein [Polyangiaceae bacterium]